MIEDQDVLFREAVSFAAEAHQGAVRKHRNIPYLLHPMEAAAIAASMTDDREVLIAALLHDTIEDTGVEPEEIRSRFGERVLDLVLQETEEKYRDRPAAETWKQRKLESLALLVSAEDPAVKILWIADKLSNVRSFYHDYLKVGSRLWENFNEKDPKEQEWYYRTVLKLTESLRDTEAWQELSFLTDRIFGANT